jgi:RNA recognition motif-containing protein
VSGSDNRRVYVGNLAYEVTWQDLKDHMKAAGLVVRADVLMDEPTGRSKVGIIGVVSVVSLYNCVYYCDNVFSFYVLSYKGCGIVEFATYGACQDAINRMHNSELHGRPIFVR